MDLALLLLQIAVILAVCRLLHGLICLIGQPPVMGEIIAGVLLGPSLLGWLAPTWYAHLFPESSFAALHALSQVGLVLFMFLVGLRLDLSELSAFRHVAGMSALLSIAIPFASGLALSQILYELGPPGAPKLPFALFIAVSMSITAFPVLARILSEHGMTSTRVGHVAIASAAFDDGAAWILLAWITAFSRSNGGNASIIGPIGLVAAFVATMAGPVRILLRKTSEHHPFINEMPPMLVFMFLASWAAETMGLHALFGAFLAGVVWPGKGPVTEEIAAKVEPVAMTVLVPLFFSYTGIHTDIGLIRGADLWSFELLIVVVAVLGKAGGAFAGAWMMGFGVRDSLALGALLNTRGLIGLVVLNVGLDLKILSRALFSMMVLMTLSTTLMTAPALNCLRRSDHAQV